MKKVIGLLLLLLGLLLVSVPVVAEGIIPFDGYALVTDSTVETKTIVQEEVVAQAVTAPSDEILIAPAVESSTAGFESLLLVINMADGSLVPDRSCLRTNIIAGNDIRAPTA